MTRKDFDASRRALFKQSAAVAVGAVAAGSLLRTWPAHAQAAKVTQAQAQYQPTPKGNQQCDKCIQFIPGQTADANGTCKVVEGSISPKGWCLLFAAKS